MEQFGRHKRGHRSRIKTSDSLSFMRSGWGFHSGKLTLPYYLGAFRALIEGKLARRRSVNKGISGVRKKIAAM